jgi:hypothetical protein
VKVNLSLEPLLTLACVQSLLKCIFKTNVSSHIATVMADGSGKDAAANFAQPGQSEIMNCHHCPLNVRFNGQSSNLYGRISRTSNYRNKWVLEQTFVAKLDSTFDWLQLNIAYVLCRARMILTERVFVVSLLRTDVNVPFHLQINAAFSTPASTFPTTSWCTPFTSLPEAQETIRPEAETQLQPRGPMRRNRDKEDYSELTKNG